VREGQERPERRPLLGLPVELVVAALPAVQHGQIGVAVDVEVGEDALSEGVAGPLDHQPL
jgi:hypothetical protein